MSDSANKTFDKDYVHYWKNRVNSVPDGSRVADDAIIERFVQYMDIRDGERVLDLGCGFGRMYPILSARSSAIIGIDVSLETLAEASRYPYSCLIQGKAERTHLPNDYVDKIITWATFDVVEQEVGLVEANRILRKAGMFLITGKNDRYHEYDEKAFIAERNAKLKDFPNHFTDVGTLLAHCDRYGFSAMHAFAFEHRGDFGENKAKDILNGGLDKFYEYLVILRKTHDVTEASETIAYEFSRVARQRAQQQGFADTRLFFQWHKDKESAGR